MDALSDEDGLLKVYEWVDQVDLSREPKNFTRDFSDAGIYSNRLNKSY